MLSGIEPGARLVEGRRIAEIGGEDLNRPRGLGRVEKLEQRHGDRVGLLARRAARHPDADRRAVRLAADDRREDLALEILEHLRVAEEARDVDQDVAVERVGLAAVALEELRVLAAAT